MTASAPAGQLGNRNATVSFLFRASWPYSVGQRWMVFVGALLSLLLFLAMAALPLLTGRLLDIALMGSRQDDVSDALAKEWLQRSDNVRLVLENNQELDAKAMVSGMTSSSVIAVASRSDEYLAAFFPGGMSYDLSGGLAQRLIGDLGEQASERQKILLAFNEDQILKRAEVERVLIGNESLVSRQAFSDIVILLAVDEDAISQRNEVRRGQFVAGALVLTAVIALAALLKFVTVQIALASTFRSARRMQDKVFAQIHNTTIVESGTLGRTSMVSRCTSYIDQVQSAIYGFLTKGLPSISNLIFSAIIVFWLDWQIGVLALIVIIIFEFVRRLSSPRWSAQVHDLLDNKTRLSEAADDAVSHIGAARSAGTEGIQRRQFAVIADASKQMKRSIAATQESFSFSALVVGQLGALIAIVVIGFARGDLAVGEATAIILYVRAMGDSIAAIPGVVVEMQEAAPHMRRLQRVLDYGERRSEVNAQLGNTPDPDAGHPLFQMSKVDFAPADGSHGCRSIDLAIDIGEWHAIVGGRQSVRHAVLMAASGFDDLVAGTVLMNGVDVFSMNLVTLQSKISIVSADPYIAASSLYDNIALGRLIDRHAVSAALHEVALHLDSFSEGLDTDISSLTLSRDVRVRIEIARAIVTSSPVVIIDDPTAQLDRMTAADLWSIMRSSFAERGVLVSTTDLERLEPGDMVSVLLSDQIVEQGSLEELAKDGRHWGPLWARSRGADDIITMLSTVPTFVDLPVEELEILASRLVTETYQPGEILFVEGDPSDRLLLVEKGSIELIASDRRLATLHDGDHVGDFDHTLDVASDVNRAFSARAVTFSVIRSLHRSAISQGSMAIVDVSPDARTVYRYLARNGAATVDELSSNLDIVDIAAALTELASSHAVVRTQDDNAVRWRISAVQRRSNSSTISRLARIDS